MKKPIGISQDKLGTIPGELVDQPGHTLGYKGSGWRVLLWLLQFGIGVLFIWWVVSWADTNIDRLRSAVAKAALVDLSLAVVFFFVSILLKATQLRVCLQRSIPNTYLLGLLLSQNAFLTFLPWRVGEISVPLMLRRHQNVPVTESVSNILFIRMVDLILIGLIVAISGIRFGIIIPWSIVGVIAACLVLLVCLAKINLGWSAVPKFVTAMRSVFRRRTGTLSFSLTAVLSAAVFISTTFQSALALRAFGLTIPLPEIAIVNAMSLLAAVLPFHPPGGWGTIDLIQVALLQEFGLQPEFTAPVILVTHGFYTVVYLVGGILGWMLCRNSSYR